MHDLRALRKAKAIQTKTLVIETHQAGGLVWARAAMAATKNIPILFIAGFDPVKVGIVSSFSRPDGNATGVSIYTTELLSKRLSLLRYFVPTRLIDKDGASTSSSSNDKVLATASQGPSGIQDGNFLPDLVAQIGGEVLDIVDRIDDDRIGQMLRIERGELVGQRQHLAAIIEIAGELEPAHRALGRGGSGCAATENRARILGELMHVDRSEEHT